VRLIVKDYTNKQSYSNNHVHWFAFGPLAQELYELVNLSKFFVDFKLFKIILGYYISGYFRLFNFMLV